MVFSVASRPQDIPDSNTNQAVHSEYLGHKFLPNHSNDNVVCYFKNKNNNFFHYMFQCSVTCGAGSSQRDVICVSELGTTHPSTECTDPKPRNTKRCTLPACPSWAYTRWTKVSEDTEHFIDNKIIFQKQHRLIPFPITWLR